MVPATAGANRGATLDDEGGKPTICLKEPCVLPVQAINQTAPRMKPAISPAALASRAVNTVIVIGAAALLYAGWDYLHKVGYRFDAGAVIVGIIAAAAAALATCLVATFEVRRNVALLAAAICLSFVAGNFALKLSGRSLAAILETKVFRQQAEPPLATMAQDTGFVSPRPPDNRDGNEVAAAIAATGIDISTMYNPAPLLPFIGNGSLPPFLPLGSRSRSFTLGCNEGDQRDYPILHTDRYGFNNDDSIYAYPDRILIVGDSFAHGSCVQQSESVATVLRRAGYPTSTVGDGGNGPILALASLKEYGEQFKPKIVLWFYFDGNDISDLRDKELRSAFLLQYLKDDFSQNLMKRQGEVDAFWNSQAWVAPQREFLSRPDLQDAWQAKLDENLPLVRKLLNADLFSLKTDEDDISIFGHVLEIAKRRVAAWGGRIVFVMIPNWDDYNGRIPPWRLRVLEAVRQIGLPIVDPDAAVRSGGDPAQYFPVRGQWGHFNPRGYALVAQQIIEELERIRAKEGAQAVPVVPPGRAAAVPAASISAVPR